MITLIKSTSQVVEQELANGFNKDFAGEAAAIDFRTALNYTMEMMQSSINIYSKHELTDKANALKDLRDMVAPFLELLGVAITSQTVEA